MTTDIKKIFKGYFNPFTWWFSWRPPLVKCRQSPFIYQRWHQPTWGAPWTWCFSSQRHSESSRQTWSTTRTEKLKPWGWRLSLGLAAAPCPSYDHRRALPPRDTQQPHRERSQGPKQTRSGEDQGYPQCECRVWRHDRCERAGKRYTTPVQAHSREEEQAPVGYGHLHAYVPDTDWDKLNSVLRAQCCFRAWGSEVMPPSTRTVMTGAVLASSTLVSIAHCW